MLIELYVQEIHNLIQSYEMVKLFNLEYEKRGLYECFIRGIINFKDDSLLHLREFVWKRG